mgnify:CR=1 FL=1
MFIFLIVSFVPIVELVLTPNAEIFFFAFFNFGYWLVIIIKLDKIL